MRRFPGQLLIVSAWLACLASVTPSFGKETILYRFKNTVEAPGTVPTCVVTDGMNIYGTCAKGNTGTGVIYKLAEDGSYTVLHEFSQGEVAGTPAPRAFGAAIGFPITLVGNTLYGTAPNGTGATLGGVVFAIETDGSNYRILHTFMPNADGKLPIGAPLVVGGVIYGVTSYGGVSPFGQGSIYRINTNGSGFTVLHYFDNEPHMGSPINGLSLVGSTLVGIVGFGTPGAIFKSDLSGQNVEIIYRQAADELINYNGNPLLVIGSKLYGVAGKFVPNRNGRTTPYYSVYSLDLSGNYQTVFTTDLKRYGGLLPFSTLVLSNSTLYGAVGSGGKKGQGALFQVNLDGTGYERLFSFVSAKTGRSPSGGLLLNAAATALIGTTAQGGFKNNGVLFNFDLTTP